MIGYVNDYGTLTVCADCRKVFPEEVVWTKFPSNFEDDNCVICYETIGVK